MVEKSSYTHEEMAADLKNEGIILDTSHVPLTQDGTFPSQHVDTSKSSGSDYAEKQGWAGGGMDATGFPVPKGSVTDVTPKMGEVNAEAANSGHVAKEDEPDSDAGKVSTEVDKDLHPEKYEEANNG